jgi:hypothetical protein
MGRIVTALHYYNLTGQHSVDAFVFGLASRGPAQRRQCISPIRLNRHALTQVEYKTTKAKQCRIYQIRCGSVKQRAKNMKRDFFQRRSYAARRMSKAVDRLILATDAADREQARKWVEVWRIVGGIRKPAQVPTNAGTDRKLRLGSLGLSHIG